MSGCCGLRTVRPALLMRSLGDRLKLRKNIFAIEGRGRGSRIGAVRCSLARADARLYPMNVIIIESSPGRSW